MYDSTEDTLAHIAKVQARLHECTNNLIVRAERHDKSKLMEPEKSGFDKSPPIFSMHYMSEEYEAGRATLQEALQHHYAVNSHHPEHWPNGIAGMSVLDLLEMVCDWGASTERVKQGSMGESLEKNKRRFGIGDQLFAILENTVKELGW